MKSLVFSAYQKKVTILNQKKVTIINYKIIANIITILGCILLASKFAVLGYSLMFTGSILWYNMTTKELRFLNGFYMAINLYGLLNYFN